MKITLLISLFSSLFLVTLLNSAFIQPSADKPIVSVSAPVVAPAPVPLAAPLVKVSFAKFLSHFEKVETPYKLQLGDSKQYDQLKIKENASRTKKKHRAAALLAKDKERMMTAYIPELSQGFFSRSGPPKVLPIARFYPNDKIIAVVYMTYQPFWPNSVSKYNLALFDLNGKQISKLAEDRSTLDLSFQLAQVSVKNTQTFSIDSQGHIWKNTYKNLWKDPIDKTGIKGNEVVGYELTTSQAFKIESTGIIEPLKDYSTEARASLD